MREGFPQGQGQGDRNDYRCNGVNGGGKDFGDHRDKGGMGFGSHQPQGNVGFQQIKDADLKRYGEVVSFLNDYKASITNVADTVRKGGVACYVVGNRNVKGVQIPLDYFTAEMFERCGFCHVTTVVRSIPNKRMPSKTSPTNVAGKKVDTMSSEYIVVMKKL